MMKTCRPNFSTDLGLFGSFRRRHHHFRSRFPVLHHAHVRIKQELHGGFEYYPYACDNTRGWESGSSVWGLTGARADKRRKRGTKVLGKGGEGGKRPPKASGWNCAVKIGLEVCMMPWGKDAEMSYPQQVENDTDTTQGV